MCEMYSKIQFANFEAARPFIPDCTWGCAMPSFVAEIRMGKRHVGNDCTQAIRDHGVPHLCRCQAWHS